MLRGELGELVFVLSEFFRRHVRAKDCARLARSLHRDSERRGLIVMVSQAPERIDAVPYPQRVAGCEGPSDVVELTLELMPERQLLALPQDLVPFLLGHLCVVRLSKILWSTPGDPGQELLGRLVADEILRTLLHECTLRL